VIIAAPSVRFRAFRVIANNDPDRASVTGSCSIPGHTSSCAGVVR